MINIKFEEMITFMPIIVTEGKIQHWIVQAINPLQAKPGTKISSKYIQSIKISECGESFHYTCS